MISRWRIRVGVKFARRRESAPKPPNGIFHSEIRDKLVPKQERICARCRIFSQIPSHVAYPNKSGRAINKSYGEYFVLGYGTCPLDRNTKSAKYSDPLASSQIPPSLSSSVWSSMAAGIVVVFDFDKTIIDVDSDNWVVDELGFTGLFDQLLHTMPWNSLMDRMMKEIHASGKTIGDIERVLRGIPIHPRIVPAIKAAHSLGCDLRVVSDANVFFIETILKHLGIRECFSEINTNPGYVDEEGRLRILPFHDFHSSPHGCSRCPPNMCKSMVVERIQASMAKEGKKRMIYLGDGIGDFCPSLKLKAGDFMMPRKDFPVWELIKENRSLLEAEIHEWSNGEDFERILLHLINRICIEDSQFLATESKFQAISIEALPKPIPVPF
nr:inorganic pyrophosphatase 1-like [Ipomoea batatas]